MDAHERNVKRMRHVLEHGLTERQREIVARHLDAIRAERVKPSDQSGPISYPLYKAPRVPKMGDGKRATADERGRGAATAASRRVERDD